MPDLTARGLQRREALVEAARSVFEERGFLDTRVSHIAERAGAAYGTFYTYFPSKEAVFMEVADRLFAEMTGIEDAPDETGSPADRLRRANRSYYRGYLRNARMMAIVEQVSTFHAEFQQRRHEHRARAAERTAQTIAHWQAAGFVDPRLDPETTARALTSMVDHSLAVWLVQGDNPPGPDGELLLDTLDALCIRALGLDEVTPSSAGPAEA